MSQEDENQLMVKVGISFDDLVVALLGMGDEDREWSLENLLAVTSQDYLESIEEAREDYRQGSIIEADIFSK